MTDHLNPESPLSTSAGTALDPNVVSSHLVAVFNERAFGTIMDWSVGTWLRTETIRSLRCLLEDLSSIAVRGTVGLGFVQQLASATGVATAVACRLDDGDMDANDDVTMVADGSDVLLMQLAEVDQRWVEPGAAERKRLRERLGHRIAQCGMKLGDDGAGDTAVELASCTAVAAAMVVHGEWLDFDARTFGVRREVTPICPACGVATTLNQGVGGWATLTGVDPKNCVASMGDPVVAEVYEVTCRDCGNDFSDRQVVEASIAFEDAAELDASNRS